MRQALALARRGRGRVEPNPMVGCLVVRAGQVIGHGHHAKFGGAHAEVVALDDCAEHGGDLEGSIVHVTLEPCCHHGKTPPCTQALIKARPKRVCISMADPFEQVRGRGIEALRRAGIEVQVGTCADEARRLNEPYLKRIDTGLPWVIAKWAQTVDGRIATRSGDSRWISNERSRRDVHALRARVDAVLVGIGTVLADDPQLTARNVPLRRVARRVVVDPTLRMPDGARLLDSSKAPLLIATSEDADTQRVAQLETRGVEVLRLPRRPDGELLQLRPLLQHLAEQHGATNVLAEGGGRLLGSLYEQGLVDQALVYVAPRLAGDERAVPCVSGLAPAIVEEASRLHLVQVRRFGEDVRLDYRLSSR